MRSHQIGTAFEYRVRDYLRAIGYRVTRKLMSGSGMKDPTDLLVSPLRLKIEAKRTMKATIRVTQKWLEKYIRKDRILVFAMGNKRGVPMGERMYAISLWPRRAPDTFPASDAVVNVIHMKKKSVRLSERDLVVIRTIQTSTKLYLVMKMREFFSTFHPLPQEKPNDRPTT